LAITLLAIAVGIDVSATSSTQKTDLAAHSGGGPRADPRRPIRIGLGARAGHDWPGEMTAKGANSRAQRSRQLDVGLGRAGQAEPLYNGVFSSKPTLGLDSIEIVPELNNFATLYQRCLYNRQIRVPACLVAVATPIVEDVAH